MGNLLLAPTLKRMKDEYGRNYVQEFWHLFGREHACMFFQDWKTSSVRRAFSLIEKNISEKGVEKKIDRFIKSANHILVDD